MQAKSKITHKDHEHEAYLGTSGQVICQILLPIFANTRFFELSNILHVSCAFQNRRLRKTDQQSPTKHLSRGSLRPIATTDLLALFINDLSRIN
jgi:hypothetical protein